MLVTAIRSKPVYATLEPDLSGTFHLLVGQGSGGDALLRLLEKMPRGADAQVLYAAESRSGVDRSEPLSAFGAVQCRIFPSMAEVVACLDQVLSTCFMGTRLYVAGSESFIGSVGQVAARYNLTGDEAQSERCGSAARRVYCIHCKTSQENVTTNVVRCAGCERHLLVRDHYSRRLAAYMGVMADAASPGTLPPVEERLA
ncbi:MAG TPA: dimethylamine monooxygenase subunit DmmA family protein [Pirellulales bacterium]|nr:dimethylamine monooxygenase subunit DmmA family protein [Pirellulales bacterium]